MFLPDPATRRLLAQDYATQRRGAARRRFRSAKPFHRTQVQVELVVGDPEVPFELVHPRLERHQRGA